MVKHMQISAHPTIDELTRWRLGEVDGEEVLAIGTHLASCRHCVSQAAERLQLDRAAATLCDDLEADDVHPDVERDLFAFVGGTAGDRSADIERHLADCSSCSETVADLRSVAVREPRPADRRLVAIAASIGVAIVVSAALWPRRDPAPVAPRSAPVRAIPRSAAVATPSGYARTDWNVLTERVRNGSPVEMPAVLRAIRTENDVLRGDVQASAAFVPSGVVVRSTRPYFSWPAPDKAQSVVQIFRDEEEVARSRVLTTSRWRPERNLQRGVTYMWQVRVTRDGNTQILPTAPTPVARFHVLDAATLSDLEAAERAHGGDHLLLGLLHARAGLGEVALSHLRRVTVAGDIDAARRVAREIESWRIAQ